MQIKWLLQRNPGTLSDKLGLFVSLVLLTRGEQVARGTRAAPTYETMQGIEVLLCLYSTLCYIIHRLQGRCPNPPAPAAHPHTVLTAGEKEGKEKPYRAGNVFLRKGHIYLLWHFLDEDCIAESHLLQVRLRNLTSSWSAMSS